MTEKKQPFMGYLVLLYAMTLFFILINNYVRRTEEHWRFFYAFTQQSNIIALIWMVLFGISQFRKTPWDHIVKHPVTMIAVTVYMSITYLIVAFVLNPFYQGAFNPLDSSSELWLHHLTPIIMAILYFKVKTTETIKVKNSLVVLVYPFVYVIANLIIGHTVTYNNGEKAFAYGFINPGSYGNNYLIFTLVILVLLIIFSTFTILLVKFKNKITEVEAQ